MTDFTRADLATALDRARDIVAAADPRAPEYRNDLEDALERVAAAIHVALGVACPECSGTGAKVYGDTSTWSGGVGGQMLTAGVCDRCWGTGRTDRQGVDLRKVRSMQRKIEGLEAREAGR